MIYTPGHLFFENFNTVFERESSKYVGNKDPSDDIIFMRV